jgi:hypothetical protein
LLRDGRLYRDVVPYEEVPLLFDREADEYLVLLLLDELLAEYELREGYTLAAGFFALLREESVATDLDARPLVTRNPELFEDIAREG